jgi:hypothetical protein
MLARRTSTTALATILTVLGLVAAPAAGRAQTASGGVVTDAGGRAALLAERQRVRADLERANAEIDALKRAGRGLRDDYRLRARLADAEALARRLTALDARLGGGTAALPVWPATSAEPRALPTDGPAELEAKADILNDQARQLAARGDALLVRAQDLRARQTLRRRVGQMERDPFAPLEGSKRRLMASGPTPLNGGSPPSGSSQPPREATTGGNTGVSTTVDTKAPGPPSDSAPGLTGVPAAAPGAVPGSTSVGPSRVVPTPASPSSEGVALSAQLRALLDPTTLAELQRLEASGGAANGYEALERAAGALKARAERLKQQAAALRSRAH